MGLPLSIVSDQDVLFMSSEFQDWTIKNGISHKVSTTYHAEADGQTERRNGELTEMFAAHELEGTDWLTAAPKVQTHVNSRISKSILKWVTCGRQSRIEQRMCERRGACEPAVEDEEAGAIAEDERSEDCLINYL